MIHRIEIAIRKGLPDPRGEHVAARVRDFLDISIGAVRTRDVYHLEADLSEDEVATVVGEFTDSISGRWCCWPGPTRVPRGLRGRGPAAGSRLPSGPGGRRSRR